MHGRPRHARMTAPLVALVLALSVSACGKEGAAPAPSTAPAPPAVPQTDPDEWSEARFFATVGPRSLRVDLGHSEAQAQPVISRMQTGDDPEARAEMLLAVESGLVSALQELDGVSPVFQVRAEPATPWVHVADLLAVATSPDVGLTAFDLRLPWDDSERRVTVVEGELEGHPLPIDFSFLPADDEGAKARWSVKVGAASTFVFHADHDPALRKLDEPSMRGLRSALHGFSRTWREDRRRAEITMPRAPSPTYINVLTVVRICVEKRFDEFTFRDGAE